MANPFPEIGVLDFETKGERILIFCHLGNLVYSRFAVRSAWSEWKLSNAAEEENDRRPYDLVMYVLDIAGCLTWLSC